MMVRFILILVTLLYSLPRAAKAQTLPLVNYTIQNGLPEATVYAVYHDRAGYLWVGTQGGVGSFDGRQFRIFDSQLGLPDNHVTAITGTDDGRIIFGHRNGAISMLRNNIITRIIHKSFVNTHIVSSLLWRDKILYAGTRGGGLYAINFRKSGYQVSRYSTVNGLPSDNINQLVVKDDTHLWVATNGGLGDFNTANQLVRRVSSPYINKKNITSICPLNDHTLWLGTDKGILSFKAGDLTKAPTVFSMKQGLLDDHINKVKADHLGNIWVATNQGIARLGNGVVKCFTKNNGLLSDIVWDLTEDREHNVWVAQDDGISCYKDSPFELYTKQDGLVYNEVYAIAQDQKNKYWIGTSQGISVYDTAAVGSDRMTTFTTKQGLLDNFVYDIFADSRKNIWVACVDKGASCYLTSQKKFMNFSSANGLRGKQVISINEDKKGRIWMALLDSGLAMYDYQTKKLQNFTKGSGFPSGSVWTIHKDRKGQLWFGCRDKGLIKMDTVTGEFKIVPGQEKLPNHNFGSVSSDSKGNIWIASIGDGVYKYDGKRFTQYGVRQGIKSNNPYFIFCDKDDHVWIGTNVGIDLFDPGSLTTRAYRKNDGFMGIETNQNAVYQARNNDLWIGTVNGLMRYRFNKEKQDLPAPLVYITQKHLFFENGQLPEGKLPYDKNYLTFDYLGVSLSNADKITYRYNLSGFSNKWSPVLTESRVSYANLPPGKYTFNVKAGYPGGKWSAPASYSFIIAPPFYKTWWFIVLAGAGLYLIGSALYQYRVNQLLRVEKLRNKIASDLHDDIGSALSSISIFSEVADKQLREQSPVDKTREVVRHISFHSRAMLDAMDDIVWAVNPNNDHFSDLAIRMREFAIPLFEARGIGFNIDVDEQIGNTRVSMEARKNIYLIFKESINNILKYSCCTFMRTSVRKLNNQLELVINDNGRGFDVDAINNRNGLKNMRMRAAEINGILNVTSSAEDGTTVTLVVNII